MEYLVGNVIVTVVAAARFVGFFLVIPLFSMVNLPSMIRVWLVIFLSLIAGPSVHLPAGFEVQSWAQLTYYIVIETLTGVSLGLVFSLALNSLYVAGSVIDMGIGFSMVNVYNPMDESEIPITTNLFYTVALIVFLMTNTHHLMIRAMVETFKYIEIGTLYTKIFNFDKMVEVLTKSYVIGMQIALPFILVIIMTNLILGILSKAMPGMNIFSIGMPLNVLSGLMLMFVLAGFYFNVFENVFQWSLDVMNSAYTSVGG